MNISFKITCIAVLCYQISTLLNPPLWAEKFSTNFSAKISSLRTKGKYWYDSIQNAERIDFQNGNALELCATILPENTPCTILTTKSKTFFVFPRKQLCCHQNGFPIRQQDWLSKFEFKKQTEAQGQTFFLWQDRSGSITYLEDQSALRRPRREVYAEGRTQFDYDVETYVQNFDSKDSFDVPEYCKEKCENFQPYENNLLNSNQ